MNSEARLEGLSKFPTGIAGFDHLTGGGLPARRTTLVLGGPGSGKTVFALQMLVSGARRGEPGIFVSFNEQPLYLVENGASFGWELAELEQDKLIFLDARLRPGVVKAGQYDLSGMLAGLRAVAAERGARRIVFDSLDVLLTLLDDRLAEAQEVFRLRDWLFENEYTALLTAGLEGTEARAMQRQALLQLIADCAVVLDYRPGAGAASRRLRVMKYRGSAFLETESPFVIGSAGIEVLQPGAPEGPHPGEEALLPDIALARQELTARIQALDRFLEMKQAELGFLREKASPSAQERVAGRTASRGAACSQAQDRGGS